MVTQVSAPPTKAPLRHSVKALLIQCREAARARLSGVLADAIAKVEQDLFRLADTSRSGAQQQACLDTIAHIRGYREVIAGEFGRYFVEAFDRRINAFADDNAAVPPASDELSGDALQLVDATVMDESFLLSDLARDTATKLNPDQSLGVRTRIAYLLSIDILDDQRNPFAPKLVYEALQSACGQIPGDFALKRLILTAFEPYVTRGIDAVYAEVNRILVAHEVLPKVRHTVQRHDHTGAYRATGGGAPGGNLGASHQTGSTQSLAARGEPTHAGNRGLHVFPGHRDVGGPANAVQHLIAAGVRAPGYVVADRAESEHLDLAQALTNTLDSSPEVRLVVARMLSEPARYSFEAALDTPATPTLLSSLSALQAAPTLDEQNSSYVAHLEPYIRAQSHPLDLLTIEFVTLVFDYLLDDKALPESVKALLARLQIVAVKTAILDRSFFARREHPMRRLLSSIALAGADPEIDTTSDSAFVVGLREIVNDIVANFKEDLAVFASAESRLATLVTEATASKSPEFDAETAALEKKEANEIALTMALAELHRRITDTTPQFVRKFLFDSWSLALVDAYQQETDVEDSWTQRLGVVDALIWSVSPRSPAEIKRLATILPQLMQGLRRGMAAVGIPEASCETFFTDLMQAHAATIAGAKAASRTQPPEPKLPQITPDTGQVPAPALDNNPLAVDTGPSSVPALDDEPISLSAATIADDDGSDANSLGADDHLRHMIAALDCGVQVKFSEAGKHQLAKLAWVSPKRTIFLFTAARAKARSLSADALADGLRTGSVEVIDRSEPLLDRVVRRVVGDSATDPVALA
jgi:hypothetical protein